MSITLHINSLPDLVLRRIFSKVPLNDLLLNGRLVCPVWESYCTQACNQVRSLTLLIGSSSAQSLISDSFFTLKYRDQLLNDGGIRMYPYSSQHLSKFFHLTFGSFNFGASTQLSNIYPQITKLEIAIKYVQGQFPKLPLLAQWSPMLKSLKMYLQFNGNLFEPFNAKATNEISNLLKVINSMQSLEHLTLDADFSIIEFLKMTPHPDSIDLPILSHLHEFNIKSGDSTHIIEQSLKRYALPNVNLKRIGLHFGNTHDDIYERLAQLASKIAYSSLYFNFNIPRHFLNQFSSLSSFSFSHYRPNPFNGELNLLASLPQLKYLHYATFGSPFSPTRTQAPREQLCQLISVQVLIIYTCWKSTSDFESDLWAHLFPNVQVIELNLAVFSSFPSTMSQHILTIHSKQEHQKVASIFSQCPKLHHIYTREKIEIISYGSYEAVESEAFEWTVLQVGDSKIIINTKQSSNV